MSKVYDGKLSTPTLSAMRLAMALMTGSLIKYPEKSTLNEHFNLLANRIPDGAERATLKYLCIGNRGHVAQTESDGFTDFVPVGKVANASGMFNAVPFVLRELDNDLSDAQRKNYAFRTQVNINGRNYWAYYLKRIDMRTVETNDYLITKQGSVQTVVDHVYTDNELFPKPIELPEYDYDDDQRVDIPDGRYVTSNADIKIVFDEFDVQEYMNVTAIMRGSSRSSVISEIALASGIDGVATGESATGSPFSYDEALGVQVLYYITLYSNLAITNENLNMTVKIGQSSPFFIGAV